MQLIKDFTAECAHDKVEFYMGMVTEEQQTFEGLVQQLKNAFQSGKTISELITDFYGWAKKKSKSEDAFGDDLQVLVQKIIARKLEFRKDANELLKTHKLKDPYYTAIACSMLQSSDDTESFAQFQGHLAMTFGGHAGQGKLAAIQSQLRFPHALYLRRLGNAGYLRTQDRGKGRLISKPCN